MKKYSRILIIANLILLLGYFNWSVYQKEQTLKEGTTRNYCNWLLSIPVR